jgi:competence protein ComEC
MASSAADAPSTRLRRLQIAGAERVFAVAKASLERWLEAERDQLFLWLPVMLGAGIASWFLLPDPLAWVVALLLALAVGLLAIAIGRNGRVGRIVMIAAMTVATGLALIWWRAESATGAILSRPLIATFEARVERVEPLAARELVRLRLVPIRVLSTPARSCKGSRPCRPIRAAEEMRRRGFPAISASTSPKRMCRPAWCAVRPSGWARD